MPRGISLGDQHYYPTYSWNHAQLSIQIKGLFLSAVIRALVLSAPREVQSQVSTRKIFARLSLSQKWLLQASILVK